MKGIIVLIFSTTNFCSFGQTVTTNPVVPSPAQPVTITFDVTGTDFALKNLTDVWLWTWLDNGVNDVNAPTNVNPATAAQDAAKLTRSSTNQYLYSITLTATTFFNRPASDIRTVGVLLKGRDWANGQTADKFITFSEGFALAFSSPSASVFFVDESESIEINVSTNQSAVIVLKSGSNILATSSGEVTEFSFIHIVTEPLGSVTITAEADNGSGILTASFKYVIRTATSSQPRPPGIIDGINYYSNDASKSTLSLWAPGKSSVYVLGDFNGWTIDPDFQMKQDGEHFWLDIRELSSGTEYAFQYMVDETLKIADPYADKILDPDDQYIPPASYPVLKPFPPKALSDQWYFNRLAVLQTNQSPYAWETTDFQKPAKETLVIYELLIRDFFGTGERNYQNLIDTLSYLKRLGVNAIELMPIMEFNGNESWGYNPTFMFAPDKYYGTKDKFKEFIDQCHQNGMAVILDIAMNHHDMPNPYVMMDFDFVNGKPEPDNKWFNVNPTHPFNVFFDMNHESSYTKKYLDTVNYFWLNEYKVDGFRFDLSKGFTQTNNPANVGAWSSYDASRIALLKRMADKIWAHSPEAYVILEHLSVNAEEKELAEYRADEGKGMMLWGKMTEQYNQLTMGYEENSDITGAHHQSRGWTVPHLVGYMESHDEERLMVKDIIYGKVSASYSAKDTLTSLSRIRAASTLFYIIPGPKMLWQFGELGYDFSINYCTDGSNNESCRVSAKPVKWDYREESRRIKLYDHVRDLLRLRNNFDVFRDGSVTISPGSSLVKQITLKNNPYTAAPTNPDEMNAVAFANFDVVEKVVQVQFPHTGTWYDYYGGAASFDVGGPTASVTVSPGGYKLFTDVPIVPTIITGSEPSVKRTLTFYPNPVYDRLTIQSENNAIIDVSW
ncbi:MAG: alpha-amylase family glycosyl hydrolase, partial [Cyclobacteriaceae bacterium]